MIIRADDVGFSDVCNSGAFETIERGLTPSADVMLDSPGTEDALRRFRSYPWISVGWHMHMWGAPVLSAEKVPSLVEEAGPFAGRFWLDLRQADDVVFEQALAELRAQQFAVGRVQDVEVLCSDRLKNWIREHRIELVNLRDALYGMQEYQNHLGSIGSELCML